MPPFIIGIIFIAVLFVRNSDSPDFPNSITDSSRDARSGDSLRRHSKIENFHNGSRFDCHTNIKNIYRIPKFFGRER